MRWPRSKRCPRSAPWPPSSGRKASRCACISVDAKQLGRGRAARPRLVSGCRATPASTRMPCSTSRLCIAAAQSRSRFVPMGEGVVCRAHACAQGNARRSRSGRRATIATARACPRSPPPGSTMCCRTRVSSRTRDFREAIERLHRAQDDAPERAEGVAGRIASVPGRRLPVGDAPRGRRARRLSRRRHGARQDAAGARGAARARRRRRRAGGRADVGVRQLARRVARFAPTLNVDALRRGRARRTGRPTPGRGRRRGRLLHAAAAGAGAVRRRARGTR